MRGQKNKIRPKENKRMKTWGRDEMGRGFQVINPRLLTVEAHFSPPCLYLWRCTPVHNTLPSWTTPLWSAGCVCECVCEKARRQARERFALAVYWYSASLNTDQSISAPVTHLETRLQARLLNRSAEDRRSDKERKLESQKGKQGGRGRGGGGGE